MLQVDPHAFAESWAAAWRRREIDSVVAYYAEDCEFISPNAIPLTGRARIKGRAALAAYWRAARENLTRVEIDVDHVVWDERTRTLVVIYDSVFDDLAGQPISRRVTPHGRYAVPLGDNTAVSVQHVDEHGILSGG